MSGTAMLRPPLWAVEASLGGVGGAGGGRGRLGGRGGGGRGGVKGREDKPSTSVIGVCPPRSPHHKPDGPLSSESPSNTFPCHSMGAREP